MKNQNGFSLIELLLYMSLLIIFQLVSMRVFILILSTSANSLNSSFVQNDARYILQRLSFDIQRSSGASVSANTLTLFIPPDTLTYSLNGKNLEVFKNGSFYADLNSSQSSVSSLSFLKISNPALLNSKADIQTKFTLVSQNGSISQSYQTTEGER